MTLQSDRLELDLKDKKPLYTESEAIAEAERCLYCVDAPCIKACPTEIDIPTFIKKIASGNVRGSAKTILDQNLLGYSCARVCPVEELCVGDCVYNAWEREPIQIGRLQRFATETAMKSKSPLLRSKKANTKRRVALIGAGPASLACAGTLALEGHQAVIFEKKDIAGGLNSTGIAPYKLHTQDAVHEVEWVRSLGVEIKTGVSVGEGGITSEKLLAEYDAVFIGVGLGADSRLGIPGEDGPGVVGATAWIEEMKLAKRTNSKLGRVIVIGGGNTAIDVARECAQLGALEVTMAYRRGAGDMSGYSHELEAARIEGVKLALHAQPVAFVRDGAGKLTAVRFANPTTKAEFEIPCDMAALAIGQSKLKELAKQFPQVQVEDRGTIRVTGPSCETNNPKVFAGGDCINGGKEVVNAVADGRNAARALIARFLKG